MKTGQLLASVAVGLVAAFVLYVAKFKGELDIPSFFLHTVSRSFMNFPFPRNVEEVKILRFLLQHSAYADVTIHNYLTPDVRHLDRLISRDDSKYPPVKVRIYNKVEKRRSLKYKDVVIWYHGGGFVAGGVLTDHAICKQLTDLTGTIIVSVDYRMAPEFVYPVPADDSYAALQWVHERIEEYGGNPNRIIVAGESAGGNLAAVVTALNLEANRAERVPIMGNMMIYPTTDIDGEHESHILYEHTGMLSGVMTQQFSRLHCGHADVSICSKDWKFSPLKTPDALLAQFPPTLVMMAKYDVLLDEGVSFHNKLVNLNVSSELVVYNSTIHGFFGKIFFPQGPVALKAVADKIKKVFQNA